MDQKLVSAIITTHNRKELLIKAVESVLSQTYKNIECIVIDDNSTDNTEEALEPFIKSGQIIYYHIDTSESKGGCYARNLGAKMSNGEYIAYLDDDDEWLPTKIEKQVKALNDNPDSGFVYCGMIREINYQDQFDDDILNKTIYPEGDLSKEVLIRIVCNTSQILMRKSIFDNISGFDLKLKYWQEYDLCIRTFQETKVAVVRENLVLYRIITNDKQRLSNKIEGWEDTVDYISNKHAHLLEKLSGKEKSLRKHYIFLDGLVRSRKTKIFKYIFKYYVLLLFNITTWKRLLKKILKIFFIS